MSEWISVKERFPSEKCKCLVYARTHNKWHGYMKTAWFTPCYEGVEDHLQGQKMWYDYDSDYGDYKINEVTHWMPLPEPPKED